MPVYVCLYVNSCLHVDDFSRVKLELVDGIEGSDYINASYIDVSL